MSLDLNRDIYATKGFSGGLLDRLVDVVTTNRQSWLGTSVRSAQPAAHTASALRSASLSVNALGRWPVPNLLPRPRRVGARREPKLARQPRGGRPWLVLRVRTGQELLVALQEPPFEPLPAL
jgi:hypothetical protein